MLKIWHVQTVAALLPLLIACEGPGSHDQPPMVQVEAFAPHDPAAYTQGLQFHEGRLYESTGLYGESTVREIDPTSGKVLRARKLPASVFGEGLTFHGDRLYVLTWREGIAYEMQPSDFSILREHRIEGEGWGLTSDGTHLIMSDGTSTLRYINPSDFSVARTVRVTDRGRPVINLNELEYVDGHIFANVYMTDTVVAIDAESGEVTASVDLSGLRPLLPRPHRAEVLNGIAYDAGSGRFYVTGKWWPTMFTVVIGKD